MADLKQWLPLSKKELALHGWDSVDVVLISGDAYVDHPSFGTAIIGRVIEREGFKVAIVAQPNWQDDLRDFKKFGKPNLFFAITSGNMDSMVNHYTAAKRLRSTDAYTAGNRSGFRPDYATTVYSNIVRKLYPDSLIILGGIEASLRRLTHYDYWSDQLMPSILDSSQADLLIYGMGEQPIKAILEIFRKNPKAKKSDFYQIAQIGYKIPQQDFLSDGNTLFLHSFQHCQKSKESFAHNFKLFEIESNKKHPKRLVEANQDHYIVINPPFPTMSESDLDAVYELPFTRLPHPKYDKKGDIPAFLMIQNSINIHRGCFGGCSFCTISAHQGKFIASRSEKSILSEVEKVSQMPYFKGYISDLGGPSANMYKMKGNNEQLCNSCQRPSCIFPEKCKNLNFNHLPLIELYQKACRIKGVKKITIGSGIRYDLLLCDQAAVNKAYHIDQYCELVIRNHVSGRLKIAPEHTEKHVLDCMRKPSFEHFLQFKQHFDTINAKYHLNQQLIPYFISSHPGCTYADMVNLAKKMKQICYHPEQVQDFTPTPMTLSSTMYYTGLDPYTGKKIFCETNAQKKKNQNACFFVNNHKKK